MFSGARGVSCGRRFPFKGNLIEMLLQIKRMDICLLTSTKTYFHFIHDIMISI